MYNFKFYDNLYKKNNVYTTLDREDVRIITFNTFDFFKNKSKFNEFDLKSNINYFTPPEIRHLEDVRILIKNIFILLYICIFLFFCMSALLLLERNIIKFFKNMSKIFLFSSSTIIGFLIVLYFLGNNFNYLFEKFHLIFFPQGNWQFPENSLIITIFPFGFFYDFFYKLLTTSFIISIILFIIGLSFLIIFRKKIGSENGA